MVGLCSVQVAALQARRIRLQIRREVVLLHAFGQLSAQVSVAGHGIRVPQVESDELYMNITSSIICLQVRFLTNLLCYLVKINPSGFTTISTSLHHTALPTALLFLFCHVRNINYCHLIPSGSLG